MIPSKKELRALMARILRTDDDLEAFCIDHDLVAIKRRFSSGMTRIQKENLILDLTESEQLWGFLNEKTNCNESNTMRMVSIEHVKSLSCAINQAYDSIEELISDDVQFGLVEVAAKEWERIFPSRSRFRAIRSELEKRLQIATKEIREYTEIWYQNKIWLTKDDNEQLDEFFGDIKEALETFNEDIIDALDIDKLIIPGIVRIIKDANWPMLQGTVERLKEMKTDIEDSLRKYAPS